MSERRRYVVGAVKVPYAQRDVAHAVLTDEDDRGFFPIAGALDEGDDYRTASVGAEVSYRVELTEEEADRFRRASNCRYVELDGQYRPTAFSPRATTLAFMEADIATATTTWTGQGVKVAILDSGTTAAARSALGVTLGAKTVFIDDGPPALSGGAITGTHGCAVLSCGVPTGGVVYDAVIVNNNGNISGSNIAAGINWAVGQGVKVINGSFGGPGLDSVVQDALTAARDAGAQCFFPAGNDNANSLDYPARFSLTLSNVHSSIAFDETTGAKSTFSNYSVDASGCAPGTNVAILTDTGTTSTSSGTSLSSPLMASLCARGLTTGQFTAIQVGAALKANTRDTGQPAAQQGHGAYSLSRALNALGASGGGSGGGGGAGAPTVRAASAASNVQGSLAVSKPAGLAVGDYLLAFQVSEDDNALSALGGPSGWTLLGSEAGLTSGGHPNVKVWGKQATSTDASASSFTFTNTDAANDNSVAVLAITAGTYNTTTPIAAGPTFRNGGSAQSTAQTAPSVTSVTDGLLITAHAADTGGTGASYTPPTGMTERADTNGGSGAFTALEVNTLALGASGTTGDKTATCSVSSGWKGVSLVINPATSSGGGSGGGTGGGGAGFGYSGFLDGQQYPTISPGTTTVNVSSSAALTTALANAVAGQRIVLTSGTYSGGFALSGKNGTSTAGISIEAGTTGGAVFGAGSTFSVTDCSYVTLKGLSFPYEVSSGSIVQFRGSSHHCRLTRCLFGPTALGTAGATKTQYVFLSGAIDYVRVDHNELRFKTTPGNAILGDGDFTTNQAVRHIRIDHNYLHDIGPEEANEKEPIRLGVSTMSKTFSYSVVERNVFVRCIAEPEIVSVKAGGVRVSGNTFLNCIGGPVYRHGTDGVMTDNYVVDDRVASGGGGGISGPFRYYRFAPSVLRDAATADSVALSEFAIYNGSTRLTGMTATATNNNSPTGEEPAKAADDNTATKWLSLNKTASILVYDFGAPVTATGYRWATGNDHSERDPVSWTVQGSTDNATWTTLDTRSNYATTSARSAFVSTDTFLWGGGGGTPPASTGQTLGVGGVATPPGAILATSDQPGVVLNITTSGTANNWRVYDGQGHKIGQVKIRASYIVVQNYHIEAQQQYGVDAKLGGSTGNHDVIIQNCDIKDLRPTGDGDLNCFTINGNNITIAYNTAIDFVGQVSSGSHTDFCQTWNDGPGDESTSNLRVIGNLCKTVDPNVDPDRGAHQFVIGEGKDSTDGGGGGSGVSQNWFIADNTTVADCKFDDIDNVTYTRNNFTGVDKRAVVVTSLSSGFKYYSDNVITGKVTVEVGASIIPGPGPATPTWTTPPT